MPAQATKLVTAEELFEMSNIGSCELVDGEIILMAPAGAEHGDVAGEIFGRIWSFVRENKLGKVYAAETGFTISRDPDTTRAADVAFVKASRLPAGRLRGYFPGAPDLVVEVISPGDRMPAVRTKVAECIGAGATSVWLVDPIARTIEVIHDNDDASHYRAGDEVREDQVLPGFVLKLDEVI